MTKIKFGCIALMLLAAIPMSSAWAGRGHGHGHGHNHHGHHHHHHGHHHRHGGGFGGLGFGLGLGLLGYGLGYYGRGPSYPSAYSYPPAGYAPNYGYAPVVTVPAAPPVYIQQQGVVQVPPQTQSSNYWHYCRNPEGYYPYVKNCPEGWLQVAPQPGQ